PHPRSRPSSPTRRSSDLQSRRGGGEPAVRRGTQARARALSRADGLARVEGAALLLLRRAGGGEDPGRPARHAGEGDQDGGGGGRDRKSTRLNSSHGSISY